MLNKNNSRYVSKFLILAIGLGFAPAAFSTQLPVRNINISDDKTTTLTSSVKGFNMNPKDDGLPGRRVGGGTR